MPLLHLGQRSYTLAMSFRMRIFWTVGELTETPCNFRKSDSLTQPQDGCARLHSSVAASVPGVVWFGCDLGMGGISFSPSRPCCARIFHITTLSAHFHPWETCRWRGCTNGKKDAAHDPRFALDPSARPRSHRRAEDRRKQQDHTVVPRRPSVPRANGRIMGPLRIGLFMCFIILHLPPASELILCGIALSSLLVSSVI
jgi:hypothetical protein